MTKIGSVPKQFADSRKILEFFLASLREMGIELARDPEPPHEWLSPFRRIDRYEAQISIDVPDEEQPDSSVFLNLHMFNAAKDKRLVWSISVTKDRICGWHVCQQGWKSAFDLFRHGLKQRLADGPESINTPVDERSALALISHIATFYNDRGNVRAQYASAPP